MIRYGLLLLPLVLGLILAAVWQSGFVSNPIIYLRADVGNLLLILGSVGSVLYVLGIGLWYRDRRHLDKTLYQVQQEHAETRRHFIRRLDHEIKNPLTAIRAALVNLHNQDSQPTLASVRAQVDRLARLSADLRKLTDLETQPLEREILDLGQLLNELLALVKERPDATCCHVRLIIPQAPWPLPPIVGDRDLIFLAMHNLVDNAFKFSTSGDTIEIRAFEDGPSVAVEVADTGPGVSEEELAHLGEELYRGSSARSVEGSGLGLALVRAIVARHQGTITIRSRLGQGTVVILRFPAAH